MKWFTDDSDLVMHCDHNSPDGVLFGGFVISLKDELHLKRDIERIKSQHADKRSPIKWNLKDLKKEYSKRGSSTNYQKMASRQPELRKEIFTAMAQYDIAIIVSLVKAYSSDKAALKKSRSNISRHVFTNALMRYAKHASELKPERAEVIMDWPTGSNSTPYDDEYASAYNTGRCGSQQNYHSGKLCDLKFSDSIYYTRMKHSTLLQLADMVVGATREFIQLTLDGDSDKHGPKVLGLLAHRFRGFPDNVIGRGIIVNKREKVLAKQLRDKFKELYVSRG